MNILMGDARYADVLERGLYNGILGGLSLSGDTYFYQNPLAGDPKRVRSGLGGCCPPMFLKITGAMPGYIYSTDRDGIYVNLFAGGLAEINLNSRKITLRQITRYSVGRQCSVYHRFGFAWEIRFEYTHSRMVPGNILAR